MRLRALREDLKAGAMFCELRASKTASGIPLAGFHFVVACDDMTKWGERDMHHAGDAYRVATEEAEADESCDRILPPPPY